MLKLVLIKHTKCYKFLPGESLFRVGNVEATIGSTLHGAEDSGTSRCSGQSDIETGPEGSGTIINVLNHEVFSVDLGLAFVDGIQIEFLQDSSSQEEPGAISSGVIGQTNLYLKIH